MSPLRKTALSRNALGNADNVMDNLLASLSSMSLSGISEVKTGSGEPESLLGDSQRPWAPMLRRRPNAPDAQDKTPGNAIGTARRPNTPDAQDKTPGNAIGTAKAAARHPWHSKCL